MDAIADGFKVTYYVGVMLAQGGTLTVREDSLFFAPSALERAMGAEDVAVPYDQIKTVEIKGTITESLMVRTKEKAYRFVGSDLDKILNLTNRAIQACPSKPKLETAAKSMSAPKSEADTQTFSTHHSQVIAQEDQCPSCSKTILPEFNFCPNCKAAIRASCKSCHRKIESEWKYCVFCSAEIS